MLCRWRVRAVDEDGQPYSAWLDKYAEFALLRLQSFSPDLSELASVDAETTHEDASRSLEKVHDFEFCILCHVLLVLFLLYTMEQEKSQGQQGNLAPLHILSPPPPSVLWVVCWTGGASDRGGFGVRARS